MAYFGAGSLSRLEGLHPDLKKILRMAILMYDFTIVSGYRNRAEQNRLYDIGMSKKRYPDSKHNTDPSEGVDIAPYPIDWNDSERFYFLAGIIRACAEFLKIKIRWGGDWDQDDDLHDQSFMDLGHFELEV